MERSAAARPLTSPYTVGFATPDDDSEIRKLLRDSAFGGSIRVSLQREPDSRLASTIEGHVHGTIVARDHVNGAVAGIASRSIRDVFINGEPARVGYLGQLRIAPAYRRRRELLQAGFDFCRRLHQRQHEARIYLAAVVADNQQAQRLLSRRAAGWPRFRPIDQLETLAIPVGTAPRSVKGVSIERGGQVPLEEIVGCLDRAGRRFQFYPRWSVEAFATDRVRGLAAEDFIVARIGNRVVGCLACWDQRAFKQVVVHGYAPGLRRWRWLINAVSPVIGLPRLPAAGTALQFAYLSHLAVDPEFEDELPAALVAQGREIARSKGLKYVVLGLPRRYRPLAAVKRAFRHRGYESILYVAVWPDGEEHAARLDDRPPYPEIALI